MDSIATPAARALPVRPEVGLPGQELALVQLLARGYAPHQMAALRGDDDAAVLADLHRALAALDADTVPAAIAAAQERGLLV